MNRSTKSRRFLGILLAITVAALALRLIVGFELRSSYPPVTSPSPQTDCYTYIQAAARVVDGTYDYSKGFYYQPFIYAVYLPCIFLVFGKGALGIIVVQSVLGAATVFICGWLFALVFGRRCGLIAAALLALARFHVFYTPFALIACLQSFLICLIALTAILATRRRSLWLWSTCGVVFGLANLTRGNVVLLLPLAVALAVWSLRKTRFNAAIAAALLVICFLLPQLPFSIVNYRATGNWQGPSTAGGAVLALGNTPESPPGGREPVFEAGGMAYPPSFSDWTESHNAKDGRRVSVAANVARWVRREPLAWAELKLRMFVLFWNKMEVPNNVSITCNGKPVGSVLLHLPILLDFWLIGGLGIAGIILALCRLKHKRSGAFLAGMALVYSLSIVLFYVLARFRLPIVPIVCGCAALTIDTLYRRFKKASLRNRRTQLITGLTLISLAFVAFGYDAYRYGWESKVLRVVRPDGVHVPLRDRYIVRDNGPLEFGGWMQQSYSGLQFSKTLVPPPSSTATGFASCVIKIFLVSSSPTSIDWRINGVNGQTMVPEGAGWVELELPIQAVVREGSGIRLDGTIASVDARQLSYFVDFQRHYGRTAINGHQVPGELVMEVCFFRKTDVH